MTFVITVLAWMFVVVYMTVFAGVMLQIRYQRTDYWDVIYALSPWRTALFLISVGWLIFA